MKPCLGVQALYTRVHSCTGRARVPAGVHRCGTARVHAETPLCACASAHVFVCAPCVNKRVCTTVYVCANVRVWCLSVSVRPCLSVCARPRVRDPAASHARPAPPTRAAPPAGAPPPLLPCMSRSRRRFPGMPREGRAAVPPGGCSPARRIRAPQGAVGTTSPGTPCAPPSSSSAGRQAAILSTGLSDGGG